MQTPRAMQTLGHTATSSPSETGKPSSAGWRLTLTTPEAAEALALHVLNRYGRSRVENAEAWVDEVTAILVRYEEAVVREVFRPGTGLQTRCRWLPMYAEIREECEKIASKHYERQQRNAPRLTGPAPDVVDPEVRARVSALIEGLTSELRAAGQDPDPRKPPPGLTDAQRKEWHAQRLDERLAELKARNEASPVAIGEELARKVGAARAEPTFRLARIAE